MRRSVVLLGTLLMVLMVAMVSPLCAAESLTVVSVAEQKVQLSATMGIEQVRYFTLDSPKRLVVDLYGVQAGNHDNEFPLSDGFNLLRVGELDNKTRFVFDVTGLVFPTFKIDTENDNVIVTWEHSQDTVANALSEPSTAGSAKVTAIDFSAEDGHSKINISLTENAETTKPTRDGNRIQFSIKNTTLPRSLRRVFDTLAFPSAIHSMTPYLVNEAGQPEVRFVIILKGDVPYQLQENASGYVFVVTDGRYEQAASVATGILPVPTQYGAFLPLAEASVPSQRSDDFTTTATVVPEIEKIEDNTSQYTGKKTSLVFNNIDIHDLLRLIGEETGDNFIVPDRVTGTVSLRLKDVPWDQALDVILEITNLVQVTDGNVVRIIPKKEFFENKEADLKALRSQQELIPLKQEIIPVSYADLESLKASLEPLLTPGKGGSITVVKRNKALIIKDLPENLDNIIEMITLLDTPDRQVLIEARIVEVDTNFTRDLGVNWGVNYDNPTSERLNTGGVAGGGSFLLGDAIGVGGLGAGFTIGNSLVNTTTLDLRISALEDNRNLKIVSQPRVVTLNGEEATITQGSQVPTIVNDGEGNATTEWKDVTLELKVTPEINPDGSIILTIDAKNDSLIPNSDAINKKSANTKVLVKDGETTVLGGVFVETNGGSESGTPFLKNIPGFGYLFKSKQTTTRKNELLIFITPRIMHDD